MIRRLRDAWQVLRGYAAAQDHRASAWAPSGGSANAEVGMATATVLTLLVVPIAYAYLDDLREAMRAWWARMVRLRG